MSKRAEKKDKSITRRMLFRFWAAALICFAVITILSFAAFQVYKNMPLSEQKILSEEAEALIKGIDGILVMDDNTSGLKKMKTAYEKLPEDQQRQVTQERYEKLTEAIRLAEAMGEGNINLIVEDKSKNGFDINFTEEGRSALKAYEGKAAFEGQADVRGEGAQDIFNRLFSGNNSFTIEAELNPNDGEDFNMICSKGDSCSAFRISERSVYFFMKGKGGEWHGAREALDEEQMHSWLHVAGVYNGKDISSYLEGSGMTTLKSVGPITPSDYPLGIGYCPETQRTSVSSIRKLHIYSQALTEDELTDGSYGPDSDNVVLWYDFDDYKYQGIDSALEGIRCYTDHVQIGEGEKTDIRTETIPYYVGDAIVYDSADETVAVVSQDGVVTGVKRGKTVVTAAVKNTDFSVEIPVKVGKPFVDLCGLLEWYIRRMVWIDAAVFALALFVIALVQRRQLISYLGRVSDAISVIGKDGSQVELPDVLGSVKDVIRGAEDRFRKKDYAAREAEKRKNDLVVYLAHDLKTPIASIIGYLTLLRDEKQISPELHQHYVEIALNNSERLDDLINEFFEITRFNMSHIVLNFQTINLTWLLEQLVSEFTPMLTEKGLTCRLDVPRNVLLRCDADKMERVFDNLLRNAINYSYRGTEICIKVAIDENVIVTCTNCGRTIPKEQIDRIFEQFYRLDSERSSSTGGSGLGLAIAKHIVELHHGKIWAESKDEKIQFTVMIPLQEKNEE